MHSYICCKFIDKCFSRSGRQEDCRQRIVREDMPALEVVTRTYDGSNGNVEEIDGMKIHGAVGCAQRAHATSQSRVNATFSHLPIV